jgi:hypothetical protein
MEILFEPREGGAMPANLTARATPIGRRYQMQVPEAELYTVLDQLHAANAKILSVSPARPTLEDYFFGLVGREQAASHAVEVNVR